MELPGPIVVREGNGGRPNIYMEAPQFHWQHMQLMGEDQHARAGIQQIAHECHNFGREVNGKLELLNAAYTPLQGLPDDVAALKARMEQVELANRQRDQREEDWRRAVLELQERCKNLEEGRRQDAGLIAQLQEDL